jgi:metal-responsive CopG/Arc/MetJ family transcriptional regulator
LLLSKESLWEKERFIYQMVSIDIMNQQINLRLPEKLIASIKEYSEEHGFSTLQEFIKETIREKLFEEPDLTREELELILKVAKVSEQKDLYGTREELFKNLKRG